MAEAALSARKCPSPALLTALGLKTEEFYPDPKMRELGLALYERAVACKGPTDGEGLVQKARYRLSLLRIWADQCRQAVPQLDKLYENHDGDYASRALYWRIQCADRAGDKLLGARLRGRIRREFPLSFHALLLDRRPVRSLALSTESRDPAVSFRSEARPELNAYARAAEALQSQGAFSLALEVMGGMENKLEGAEASFRLYLALLAKRSGNPIGKFRLLPGAFKEEPAAISRPAMELFYPLARLPLLKRQGRTVDPLLLAALIRQESGFNERARSPVGARGLMQLMPATARRMERVSKRALFRPATNVRLGARYFRGLLARFDHDVELALAAYNAGPERVDDWSRRYTVSDRVLFLDLIPYSETRNYVALIVRNYVWYKYLYGDEVGSHPSGHGAAEIKSLGKAPFAL
jgi:soluble lytic murein transglycosylase